MAADPLADPLGASPRDDAVAADPLTVAVVRLDADLPLPSYAHPGDAGLDLRARTSGIVAAGGGRLLVPTGIALAIPRGYAGMVFPRSGLALRHGVTLANAPGLIDSAYRGELQVILLNTDPAADYAVERGDRIAQLVVQRVTEVTWRELATHDDLDGENRGGGFGHTGRR
ncbi:MAG: dUTP diphosphatase [Ilumatobacteraceae bacterium]